MTKLNDVLAALKNTDRRRAASLLLILAVGATLVRWTAQVTEERMRADLLDEARIAAQAIHVGYVLSLSGSEEDLSAPGYGRLKEQLARMRRASPGCRFLYLMGQRVDGVIFFFVDSLPPDSEDYAPPGLVYAEVSDSYLQAFDARRETVVGPVTDRWGALVTALVPLTDPQTGELVAVLGMDVEASDWEREIMRRCLVPFVATLLLVVLILLLAAQRQQIRARRESKARYRLHFESVSDIVYSLDSEFRILDMSPSVERLLGYKPEELIGRLFQELNVLAPECLEQAFSDAMRVLGGERITSTVYQFIARDGAKKWGEVSGAPLFRDGQVVALVSVARDITERVQVEEALRKSEERYRTLFEAVPVGLYRTTPDGQLLDANQSMARMLGYPDRESLLAVNAVNLYANPKDRRQWQTLLELKEVTHNYKVQLLRRDRAIIWGQESARVIRDDEGQALYYDGTIKDITERVRAEELARTQRDLALALGAAFALDETLRLCLETALRISGMDCGGIYLVDETFGTLDLALYKNLSPDFVSSASHYEADAPHTQLVMAGEPVYSKHLQLGVPVDEVQKREALRAMAILPVRHEDRVIACLHVASHTLDEAPTFARTALEAIAAQMGSAIVRVQAEQALRESEERFRLAFRTSPDAINISRLQDGLFIDINEGFTDIMGYTRDDVIGKTSLELDIWKNPQDRARLAAGLKKDGYYDNLEVEFVTKDGSIKIGLVSAKIIELHDAPHILSISRDITARMRAQDALQESENKLDGILSAMDDYVFTFDAEGRFTFSRTPPDKALYTPPTTFIGKKHRDVMPPDVDALFVEAFEKTKIGQVAEYDYGLDMDVEDKWFSAKLSPMFVADEFAGVVAVVRDITARVQAEEQIKQALAEKTTLLQELYHRTRNNMQVIQSMLALRSLHVQDEQLLTIVKDVQDKIQAMALVHQKLYDSRDLSRIDLKEYIDDLTAHLLQSYQVLPGKISLDLDTDSVFVLIDTAIPCGLVLSELISNALKHAFPGDRKGRISIRLHQAEDETITLQVSDDGIGVPGDLNLEQSDSLGLQTVVGIVERQLQGDISLETGRGVAWQIQFRDHLYSPRV